jgi:hypothetical protein
VTGPTVWTAMLADPTIPVDRETLRKVVQDQRSWSRQWIYPIARPVSLTLVWLIRVAKRFAPQRLSAHATMDRLCVWFLRRCVSPIAGELLIRHFLIETNLLNFIVRNAHVPGVREVTLRPTTLRELGDRAVITHDINVYEVLIGLGVDSRSGGPLDRRAAADRSRLDYRMLTMPAVDASPQRRRLLNLDIQTALCLMNIPFALCLTGEEYRRAVHSMRLDESLLTLLADLTGDETFLRWRPAGGAGGPVVRVDSGLEVPRAVYEHAVICEYAHAHLLRQQSRARDPASA